MAGSYTANTGSLKFDLSKADEHDIVGACKAQVEKIRKQKAELQSASIGVSTPVTQQTTSRDTLSDQLQKLKTHLDKADLPHSAVYKKAIQLTLERGGKPEVFARQVPAEVKEIIKQTGQNSQIFDHTESTPVANQIIEDSYKNIVDLSQGLMMTPVGDLPQAQTDLVFTAVDLSVSAADEAQRGNYATAFELLTCAQRGLECAKKHSARKLYIQQYGQFLKHTCGTNIHILIGKHILQNSINNKCNNMLILQYKHAQKQAGQLANSFLNAYYS